MANYRQITGPDGHLAHMRAFVGNSMIGYVTPNGRYVGSYGELPDEHRIFLADATIRADLVYVVLSYATPIAWVDKHGIVTIPDFNYSVTTSRQQGACRAWLASAHIPVGA